MNTVKFNALSHRMSRLDKKEFDTFMGEGEEKTPIVVDHEAQIRQAQGT